MSTRRAFCRAATVPRPARLVRKRAPVLNGVARCSGVKLWQTRMQFGRNQAMPQFANVPQAATVTRDTAAAPDQPAISRRALLSASAGLVGAAAMASGAARAQAPTAQAPTAQPAMPAS